MARFGKQMYGITMAEVLIAVAIVGILAAVAMPAFQGMIERNQIKQVAEAFKSDMQFARAEALKTGKEIYVSRTPGSDGAWCYGINPNAACSCGTAGSCATRTVAGSSFANTVSMEVPATSSSDDSVFEHRRGTVTADTVTFTTDNYSATVSFNQTGQVTACMSFASGNCD